MSLSLPVDSNDARRKGLEKKKTPIGTCVCVCVFTKAEIPTEGMRGCNETGVGRNSGGGWSLARRKAALALVESGRNVEGNVVERNKDTFPLWGGGRGGG